MTKVFSRLVAPLLRETLEGGTPNADASCRMTALLAFPSVGGAVVLIFSRPSLAPAISLWLLRGCTRTEIIRLAATGQRGSGL